jgi:hypothetical protein
MIRVGGRETGLCRHELDEMIMMVFGHVLSAQARFQNPTGFGPDLGIVRLLPIVGPQQAIQFERKKTRLCRARAGSGVWSGNINFRCGLTDRGGTRPSKACAKNYGEAPHQQAVKTIPKMDFVWACRPCGTSSPGYVATQGKAANRCENHPGTG